MTLDSRVVYSGMVPGLLDGTYQAADVCLNVRALARRGEVGLEVGRAERLDRSTRTLVLADGSALPYDLISFNLGSRLLGHDFPGVREHAVPIKPLSRALALAVQLTRSPPEDATVVGGGAAGVELAFALRTRGVRRVRLLDGSEELLGGYRPRVRRRVHRLLERRGIAVRAGHLVTGVEPSAVRIETGERSASALTVWATGPSAPPLFRKSGLTTDRQGFLAIDDTLRYVGDERVFAVGDCAAPIGHPWMPRAGVYAVRQGPVLWQALLAAARGRRPPTFRPQRDFLSLLKTGRHEALLSFRGIVAHGGLAWRLKHSIDRRFVRRYQRFATGASN